MFISLLLTILLGICLGIITGLIPGVHVNLISVLLLSLSSILLAYFSPLLLSVIIISMAITHTFLDTIPSVFLGVPEEETALSILPGHRLLLEGKGFEAVMLTVFGSLGGLVLAFFCIPLLLYLVDWIYPLISSYIGWLLLGVSIFLILRDEQRLWALFIFILSGCLGFVALALPIDEVLFPLFSGLFGVSMLVMSLQTKVNIPTQIISEIDIRGSGKALSVAVFVGWLASFLPGLGPAQAAVIASQIVSLTEKGFLILVGALSTVNLLLSLVTFYVLDKARNGAVVTVKELITINFFEFLIFLCVAVIVGGVASILAIYLSKGFSSFIVKVKYSLVCVLVIFLIVILVLLITKWVGLLVLFVSTAVGIIPAIKGVSRSHMMGCLLIPVMSYFLI